jgi:ParB family chromosome partitioning protein
MTFKKRGLGRGLEALLAEVQVKDDSRIAEERSEAEQLPAVIQVAEVMPRLGTPDLPALNQQAELTFALMKNIHRERLDVLAEAEALLALIDEFEKLIQTDIFKT